MKKIIPLSLLTSLLISTQVYCEDIASTTIETSDVEALYAGKSTIDATKSLTQNIQFGFANTSGNTETLNLNAKYLMSFTSIGLMDNVLKVSFDSSAFLSKNNQVKNNEEYTANLGLEQYLDDFWLGYASANWLRNTFRNFNNKLSLGLGTGAALYQDAYQAFKIKIGLAYNIEEYSNADKKQQYTSLNQYMEYTNTLNKTSDLFIKLGISENIEDFQNYEFLAVAGLHFSISQNLTVNIEEEIRYDKTPPSNSNNTDTKTIISIGYNF